MFWRTLRRGPIPNERHAMKSMLHAKVERQNKHRQRKRSGKPTDELIRGRENTKARRVALSQQLTGRSPEKGFKQ